MTKQVIAWYTVFVKPLGRKKAIALYETRLSKKYVVMTAVFYFLAAVLWYVLCVLTPYMGDVRVSPKDNARITVEALSATEEDKARAEEQKERALLMPTSRQTFYRRLHLIASAERTIDFIVYDNYDDSGVEYFYGAVLCAADRGVKVRLLFDGKMGVIVGKNKKLQDILQNHNNIEVWLFNPVNIWRPAGLMTLCHDKITVVDGEKLIVGGANLGMYAYTDNYDMEVMVTNSGKDGCAGEATRYFDALINSGFAKRKKSNKSDKTEKERYKTRFSEYFERFGTEFGEEIDYATQGVAADKITFLSNPISDEKKAPVILKALYNLAKSSKQTTVITPYALLEDDKIDKIRAVAAKSERFTLVTNSLYNTRNVGYAVYYNDREKYIDKNIELMEFQAKNQLHAKMYSFDGRYSVIGSFNLDERSAHIDTESVLIIDSPEFNAVVEKYIADVFISNSLRVGKDNKYIPSDTVAEGKVPSGKNTEYKLWNILSAVIYLL